MGDKGGKKNKDKMHKQQEEKLKQDAKVKKDKLPAAKPVK